jgi:DHA1 family inner membrane transport protein
MALFIFGAETFIFSPILSNISSDISATQQDTARAASAYIFVYAVLAPICASFVSKVDKHYVILVGLILFLAGNIVMATALNIEVLTLARGLSGAGGALAGPALWATIVDKSPAPARGRAIGIGMAAFSLGQVIGVPIGGYLAVIFNWQAIFYVISGAIIGVGIWAHYVRSSDPTNLKHRFKSNFMFLNGASDIFDIWKSRQTAMVLILIIVFHAANLGGYAYLGVMLLSKFGMDSAESGIIGIAVGAGSVFGALIAGRFSDSSAAIIFSAPLRLAIWSIVLLISSVLVYVSENVSFLISFIFVWFIASGGFVTDSQAIIISRYSRNRALASAWNTSSMYIGTFIGIFTLGVFIGKWYHIAIALIIFQLFAIILCICLSKIRRNDIYRASPHNF